MGEAGVKRLIVLGLSLAALGACASPAPPPPPPPPRPVAPPPPPPAPPQAPDTCGARPLQSLIGKNKSEIPVPVDMSKRRVYCSSCAITMDYRADRLNIVFDPETGIVKEVKCG
ncbi:MAG: peptidase inhibitor [Caulobacter sp.]|nr:peptidase inhibitor [Caulobacter sp.]